MRVHHRTAAVIGCVVIALGSSAMAQNPDGEDKRNRLALYLWATGINGDITIQGTQVPVDVSFGELFDDVEIAGSIHYERSAGRWVALVDGTYIDMEADFTDPGSGMPGVQATTFQLWEAAAVRRWGPGGNKTYFDLLFGLRYWDLDLDITISGMPAASGSKSWVDGMLGARVFVPMSKKWLFSGRMDVATGGSDITWNGSALFTWKATNLLSLILGYRYLILDYEDGAGATLFAMDADMSGPLLAAGFRW